MGGARKRQDASLIDDYCVQLGLLLERKHTERVLVAAKEQAEAAALLAREAMRQAQEADRAKGNFLATVTHELRTPLNAIIGFSEVIQSSQPGGENAAYAQHIHESGKRLLGRLNEVIVLARIEAGRMALDEQLTSLDEVLRPAIRSVQASAAAKGVTIVTAISDLPLRVDPVKINQAAVNLLSNAVKFTPGGGTVEVRAGVDDDGLVVISVEDTGCGVPAERLAGVLEPFSQAQDHLTREHEGIGLGLPIARGLARLHGGDLMLTSEVGRGTTAQIRLPPDRLLSLNPNHDEPR